MGVFFNQNNTSLKKALNSEIYIDKSMLIDVANKFINTTNQYLCVSRPRRFGKSMAADMLVAYYSRGANSRELFKNLEISKTENFEKHLNKYNVIHFTMTDFSEMTVEEMQNKLTKFLKKAILKTYKNIDFIDEDDPIMILQDVYEETEIPFVFVIDEWDCIMRKTMQDEREQIKYLDFLRRLLKDKDYVALAYMTGILPVKKYGEHSALNMFTEYSMENQRELAQFTGFTENEVKELCVKYNMNFEKTKKWYDGYNVKGLSIYNPRSVVLSMTGGDYFNYWTQTETYTALKRYVVLNFDGLKEKIELMISGEKVKVDTKTFQNDITSFSYADDVLTLLIHLGYLTYDFDTKTCWIPNNEVAEEFLRSIKDGGWEPVINAIKLSDECLKATINGDENKVAEIVEKVHQENTSIIKYNDENSLACVVALAYYTAKNQYEIFRELPTGKGYADIAFIPRQNENVVPIVVELKKEQDTSIAIEQIKNKQYADILKNIKGEIILVGINYTTDKETNYKKHTCKIEKIIKE